MTQTHTLDAFESVAAQLRDEGVRGEYEQVGSGFRPSLVPRLLGSLLIGSGNVVYGREPSYLKFRAVEVIARVPYHSWESAVYTLLTRFYTDEAKALALSDTARFARLAQDNETMHVVVISALAKKHGVRGSMRHGAIPALFGLFYFWASYWLYLLNPRYSFELNYLFEDHAYRQYSRFIEREREALRSQTIDSAFLRRYGRNPRSELEFFESVRNDELVHRNQSLHCIGL